MSLILTIDALGKRYGKLPTAVMNESTTFDLYIMDASLAFENYHHNKNANGGKEPLPNYSDDELLNMISKTKE